MQKNIEIKKQFEPQLNNVKKILSNEYQCSPNYDFGSKCIFYLHRCFHQLKFTYLDLFWSISEIKFLYVLKHENAKHLTQNLKYI